MKSNEPLEWSGATGRTGPLGWLLVCPLRNGPGLVLVVLGEADVSTAGQLRDSLLAAFAFAPASIVVDLSGLTFCALAGLDALNHAVAAADSFGIPLELRGMSRQLAWMHRTFPARPAVPVARRARIVAPQSPPAQATSPTTVRRLGPVGGRMAHRFLVLEEGA